MKGWLLDTNVVSEWTKPNPNSKVVRFLIAAKKSELFTSSVTIAEIRFGIASLEASPRKSALSAWLDQELIAYFDNRFLQITESELISTFNVVDVANRKRQTVTVADALIAGIASYHKLAVVTRNTKDFIAFGIPTLNPWTGERFNGA